MLGSERSITASDVVAMLSKHPGLSEFANHDSLIPRIDILPGSLAEPNLGLSNAKFTDLANSLETIYHLSVVVSLAQSYSALKRVNVDSTRDITRMAALGSGTSGSGVTRSTKIHYLSTWSVLHLQRWKTSTSSGAPGQHGHLVKSETAPDFFTPSVVDLAYFKTRWAAEMLLSQASERGIPASVYRPSALGADTQTLVSGASGLPPNPLSGTTATENNFFFGLLGVMMVSGAIPEFGDGDEAALDIDVVTPDYIVETILHLEAATAASATGTTDVGRAVRKLGVFHIRNPQALSLSQVSEMFLQKPGAVSRLPVENWLQKLEGLQELDSSLVELAREYVDVGHRRFALDDSKTRSVLQQSYEEIGHLCPRVDRESIWRDCKVCRRRDDD